MLKNITKVTLRLMAATLFLIFFNTIGLSYGFELPVNYFNIIVLAGFGIPGLIALILLGYLV